MIEMNNELIRRMASQDKRLDDRKFDEYRKIEIEKDVITQAAGSAKVKIGDTEVVAGIKIEIGTPFDDRPNEGVLMVNAEFVPLASPDFENGPPRENSIEVARVVDRTIRESKCIDLEKLCIESGEKVWMVFIDVDVLDNHGNLIDAVCLAASSALLNAKIPELDSEGKPIYNKKGKKSLPIKGKPVATTFVKINEKIMVDPSISEVEAIDARLTIGSIDNGAKTSLCAMQKGGSVGLSPEEIEEIIKASEKKSNELRKLL